MAKIEYPLEQVLEVKKERVKRAEKVVDEKKRALEIEQEKLKKVEAERDEIKRHHREKLEQIRHAFDLGTTSEEVLQKKAYLKVVEQRVNKVEQRVAEQIKQVQAAENALTAAQQELHIKRMEEEKLTLHREEWIKEMKKELAHQEAKEQDEIGQLLYESRKRKQE